MVTRTVPGNGQVTSVGRLSVTEWEDLLRDQLRAGGLWIRDARGPSFGELRPYGPRVSPGFPVYDDLESRLLRAVEHPDPAIAHTMATVSAYAYSSAETVAM